jgi:hypothetical protein
MLEKVFYTSVLVSDQDEALDFYTNCGEVVSGDGSWAAPPHC